MGKRKFIQSLAKGPAKNRDEHEKQHFKLRAEQRISPPLTPSEEANIRHQIKGKKGVKQSILIRKEIRIYARHLITLREEKYVVIWDRNLHNLVTIWKYKAPRRVVE